MKSASSSWKQPSRFSELSRVGHVQVSVEQTLPHRSEPGIHATGSLCARKTAAVSVSPCAGGGDIRGKDIHAPPLNRQLLSMLPLVQAM